MVSWGMQQRRRFTPFVCVSFHERPRRSHLCITSPAGMNEPRVLIKPSAASVIECAAYRRPFRIISFTFCRRASMSGSAKPVSSVLTPLVLLLVPLMALLSWAWVISPGGP